MKYFWAKTKVNGEPGKSVKSHMNDVRAVANFLLNSKEAFFLKYGLDNKMLACLAVLHDIGKISPGFQSKSIQWLEQNNLSNIAKNFAWNAIHEKDHSKITQYTIQNILRKNKMKQESAELWAALLGSHHGRLNRPGIIPKGCKPNDEWEERREKEVKDFLDQIILPDFNVDISWPLTWWLAGLVSVSDWIGSNEKWFLPDKETTAPQSDVLASESVRSIGFDIPELKKAITFKDIFQFFPNDLQIKAGEAILEPGLYIIEAPMGMGKTEAALWASYKLISTGKASGIYFALPTQITSNKIYERVQKFLLRISSTQVSSRLIHANSWLSENISMPLLNTGTTSEKESKQDTKDWFASKKRALLAPFGVGTVDQALMSVIAVKHFFVRQFALAGKVVIIDEVHSYDLYTGTLIKTLCERLLPLGCTIIILSATLTRKLKKTFIDIPDNYDEEAYPFISGKKYVEGKSLFVPVKKSEEKNVKISFKNQSDALAIAVENAKNGASVLWVCNTVNRAQEMYQLTDNNIEKGLLHARFPLFRREELENYWMEKFGKDNKNRSGCILFSTQIVEQSVDLDADLMISELAPTDMLLQRMGRLWRHLREKRPCQKPEFCIIAEKHSFKEFKNASAQKIKKMFGSKAKIYASYVLLKSLEVWKDIKNVNLPDDIRGLLKQTYEIRTSESEGWQKLAEEIEGDNFALKMSAEFEANVWNPLLNDEEGTAKTRINNYPTIQMILADELQKKKDKSSKWRDYRIR